MIVIVFTLSILLFMFFRYYPKNNYSKININSLPDSKYVKMLIFGDSLEPVNICHDSVVFVDRLTINEYSNLELPKACVFSKTPDKRGRSRYTAGVVFGRCKNTDDINSVLDNIFGNKNFDNFRRDMRYVSDDFIRKNLEIPEEIKNISLYMKLDENGQFVLKCVDSINIYGYIKHAFEKEIKLDFRT